MQSVMKDIINNQSGTATIQDILRTRIILNIPNGKKVRKITETRNMMTEGKTINRPGCSCKILR
jgi:hypothetical protein